METQPTVTVEVALKGLQVELQLDGKPVAMLPPYAAATLAANLLHAARLIETGTRHTPSFVPSRS